MAVYAIQMGDDGPVKVGIALDVKRRLGSLQTASPVRLRLLHVWEGGRKLEAAIHARLADFRLNGEWFQPHPDLLSGAVAAGVAPDTLTKPAERASALSEWLRSNRGRLSVSDVARACGVHEGTIHKWASGENVPRPKAMKRLLALTEGAIGVADFYMVAPDTSASGSNA